ncbi:MAG: sugar phosphate isomerase/epimerase, partial [Arenibacter sp.]|nr:sugar phosphate isomerase/epimerase [Arenibacter sp.]
MKISRLSNVVLSLLLIGMFIGNAQDQFGGLALYTVRNDMKQDAKATLQAVADAGYKNIEAAGYADGKFYGMAPADFKAYLNK